MEDLYAFRKEINRQRRQTIDQKSVLSDNSATSVTDIQNSVVGNSDENNKRVFVILQEPFRSGREDGKLRLAYRIYTSQTWNVILLSEIIITYFISTCIYTFDVRGSDVLYWNSFVIVFNFIFIADFLFTCGLKFSDRWRKLLNPVVPSIFRVIVDGILAFPYAILFLLIHNDGEDVARLGIHALVPFMNFLRTYKIGRYFYAKSSQAGSNQWISFLLQYLLIFLICVHTWTCVWYYFSYNDYDLDKIQNSWSGCVSVLPRETALDWYVTSFYLSVMYLTTNCLGELYPITTSERIASIMAILIGFLLTTIVFVGSMTSQFITITTRKSKYTTKLKKIQNYLKLIKMDPAITNRILRYYQDLWYEKSGVFKPSFFYLLPYPLQMEISYDLNAIPLYSSLIFRKLPESYLRRLSLEMKHQFYLPGDIVYNHNQNKTFMVCITNGVLEILSDEDDETPMISFAKGTCFGEISLVYNIPARCTVKAATYVECQVLEKYDFIKLMMTYPEVVNRIKMEIQERIRRSQNHRDEQIKRNVFTINVFASKDRQKSSIKRLKDTLRYIQGKTEENPQNSEDYLENRCLDLYIISDHIKKRNTKFTCIFDKFPWILEHNCYCVKFWRRYMLFIVFYICFCYPYFIGFKKEFPRGIFVCIEYIVDLSLRFNIFVSSITAIKTKKNYINTFKGILQYRLTTLSFYLDIMALIPVADLVHFNDMYEDYYDDYQNNLYIFCKGIKLCLVWRISRFFQELELKLLNNIIIVKVVKYCVYICLTCYWSGVILYMESCFVKRCAKSSWYDRVMNEFDDSNAVVNSKGQYHYITSVYFGSTILLSVGYGDLTPGDHFDMVIVAFLSLYGMLLFGFCVAEISSVVTHGTRVRTAFLEVIMTMEKFVQENHMPFSIKARITSFLELQWQYNEGVELTSENWLETTFLPSELRRKVLHQARFKALTSVQFFQVKNKAFIQTLTERAKEILLPPGEIVYYVGTVSRDLYIIENGYCLLTSKHLQETKRERIYGPGRCVGLLMLLYGQPAVGTMITLTHCKLISLSYSDYTSALSLFPEQREHDDLIRQEEMDKLHDNYKPETFDNQFYLKHFLKQKVKIRSFFQDFKENSFIFVKKHYKKPTDYSQSFNDFRFLSSVAKYLLMPITIKPDGIIFQVWHAMRLLVAVSLSLLIPTAIAVSTSSDIQSIPIIILEAFCGLDMYVMLHLAYYGPKNQLICHPYMTARRYLKGPFILDFLINFPWYYAARLIHDYNRGHDKMASAMSCSNCHCYLNIITAFQIYKVPIAFRADSINTLKRSYMMSVFKFLLLTVFFLNFYSSLLITMTCKYVGASSVDAFYHAHKQASNRDYKYMRTEYSPEGAMLCLSGSWIDKTTMHKSTTLKPSTVYLLALYWTTSSFCGSGFGDITAEGTANLILGCFIIIHGSLFFGYVYAKIASLKAVSDQMATDFQENMKHLYFFCNAEKVSWDLKRKIIEYWNYQWKRTGGWSHQSILTKLHANLKEDAVLHMYEQTLREIPLFDGVEFSFFRAIAKHLRQEFFQKNYVVTKCNEVMTNIYIIYRGKVDVLSANREVECCMGPGGIFGNIRGTANYLTMSNIVATRNIDLLCISGIEFHTLLKSYPAVLKRVRRAIKLVPKDYVLPNNLYEINEYVYQPQESEEDNGSDGDTMRLGSNVVNMDVPYDDQLSHGSKSIPSQYNIYHISIVLLFFNPHKWFRVSVVPDSFCMTLFEYFMTLVSFGDFMILVYQMAFTSISHFVYLCIALDALYVIKFIIEIHTGYIDRFGEYVLNPKKVRQKFFSNVSDRRRDFLSLFLVCYLAFAFPLRPQTKLYLFTYLRTPQLFRITYLSSYKSYKSSMFTNLYWKLLKIIIWATVLSHVFACLFYKLSCMTKWQCVSKNWISKKQLNLIRYHAMGFYFPIYVASMWYIFNLLTITGTGDVTAQNSFEVIETIIIIVIIKFCTGLLISEMSALLTAHASSRIAYDYGMNELRDGMRDMNLSEHQLNKMWEYMRELWDRQQGKQIPILIQRLPFRLSSEVMLALYGSHLEESVIFGTTEHEFKCMLCMWMQHCVFFAGNYIVQCGDSDMCVYFIHRGEVEVLTVHPNLTESIYDVLGPKDCFGLAQGLFVGVSHYFSFRARTVVDVIYLKLDQWKYLLDFYPKSAQIIRRKVDNLYLAT